MNSPKTFFIFAGLLTLVSFKASAQTTVVTVTNVVTVVVTNVVTVTNLVVAPPSPAPKGTVVPVVPKKKPWESSVSAGLTLVRGNSDTTMFSAAFLTERKTPFDEYKIGLAGAYGVQDSKDTVNNYKAFTQWNHFFSERSYGYLRAEGLRDYIANIDYRLTIGPGVGYYLIKGTNTTLAAEAGAGFEAERLGGSDKTFATVRLAERFEHKFNDRARVWQSVEVIPQVDKLDNYVVNFEIGLESSITKSFSLKTYLDDTYANRPSPGYKKNDIKIVAGVAYKF